MGTWFWQLGNTKDFQQWKFSLSHQRLALLTSFGLFVVTLHLQSGKQPKLTGMFLLWNKLNILSISIAPGSWPESTLGVTMQIGLAGNANILSVVLPPEFYNQSGGGGKLIDFQNNKIGLFGLLKLLSQRLTGTGVCPTRDFCGV